MLVCIMCIILVELNFTSILLSFLDKQSLGLWQHLRVCSCFACKARVERADVIDYVRLVETAAAVAAANVHYSIEASRTESSLLFYAVSLLVHISKRHSVHLTARPSCFSNENCPSLRFSHHVIYISSALYAALYLSVLRLCLPFHFPN
jgi:hypothetical protein